MISHKSSRRDRFRPRKGLTLFEVLLSLAIFTAALTAIGQLISNGMQGSVHARLQSEAVIRCESQLAELLILGEPIPSVSDEPFEDDPQWTWSAESSETEEVGLLFLTIVVNHTSDNMIGEASFTLSRFYRDPLLLTESEETEETQSGGTQ